MIRLLLADDEDLLRGALSSLLELEEDLTVVAEAATRRRSADAELVALGVGHHHVVTGELPQ